MYKMTIGMMLLAGGLGGGAMITDTSNNNVSIVIRAKAKPAAKVISNRKITRQIVHTIKGNIYASAKLTKIKHYANHYRYTTFYRTRQARVIKSNGKTAIYQYIKTPSGKTKGWIWHGYLKKGQAPKEGSPKRGVAFNVAQANRDFLTIVNKGRAKKGLKPLTLDTKLTQFASDWAVVLAKNPDKDDSYYNSEAKKYAIPGYFLAGNSLGGGGISENDNQWAKEQAKELLHPTYTARKNNTYNDLLDPVASVIGIGWYPHGTDGYCTFVIRSKPSY